MLQRKIGAFGQGHRTRIGVFAVGLGVFALAGCGGNDTAERQKQADEIAKGIESYLALIEDPSQPVGLRHDKVTVTPDTADKGFAVAVTGLKFGTAGSGPGMTVGEIDYVLTPQDENTYQVSGLKMPAEMPAIGPDGKPIATVKFETTSFSAVWSKPLMNFLKLDWQAKNLSVRATGAGDDLAQADAMDMKVDGKDSGKGLLDQTMVFAVTGISGADPTGGGKFKLAKVTSNVAVAGLDLPNYMQQMVKVRGVMEKLAAEAQAKSDEAKAGGTAATTPPAPVTDDDRKALAEALRALPKTISTYSYDFEAEGLTVTDKDGTTPVTLAHGGMGMAFKGINTDKAELDLNIKHDGLVLGGADVEDPMIKAIVPKSGNLSLAATDLPVPALVEAVAQAVPQLTSGDAAAMQGAQMEIMGALMSALAKSTIKLHIDPSNLESERAHLSADGDLTVAMQSPVMAVGVVNVALTGLDDLVALANSLAQQSPEAAGAIGMLQMVQGLAKRETGSDGKPVDSFKVELTPTGEMLVNGKPLSGM
jgi:hypothetical protein